jgi:hypothetical protein
LFFAQFVKLDAKFDSSRSLFGLIHCSPGETCLVCPLCISLHFAQAGVAGDSGYLVHRASGFCKTTGSSVNAGAKMHRLAGAKIHQRCWQEDPQLGVLWPACGNTQ